MKPRERRVREVERQDEAQRERRVRGVEKQDEAQRERGRESYVM